MSNKAKAWHHIHLHQLNMSEEEKDGKVRIVFNKRQELTPDEIAILHNSIRRERLQSELNAILHG